jgi:glucokinase
LAEGGLWLGIDVGGTKCVLALGRADREVLAELRLEDWASGSGENDVRTLVTEARGLLDNTGTRPEQVRVIGVSAPGPLDPERGIVLDAPNLHGWHQLPLRARLEAELGVPVRVENDANAAALAEWRFGAGRGARNLIFLTMSTGVGGGLILDGRLYRGGSFQAGEVGHIQIVPGGRLCGCGLRGCLEAYTSGANIAARIREDVERGEGRAILELAGGDASRISARHWVEAIRAGDAYALRLRDEYLEALSHGLGILVMTLNPDRIVLGTMIRENTDLFLDELRARLRQRVWPSFAHVDVVPGELGARLPAYAALAVASLGPPEPSPDAPE